MDGAAHEELVLLLARASGFDICSLCKSLDMARGARPKECRHVCCGGCFKALVANCSTTRCPRKCGDYHECSACRSAVFSCPTCRAECRAGGIRPCSLIFFKETFTCPVEGCAAVADSPAALEGHLHACAQTVAQCAVCKDFVRFRDHAEHALLHADDEECPRCAKRVPSKELPDHTERTCPARVRGCPRCCAEMPHSALAGHEGACPVAECARCAGLYDKARPHHCWKRLQECPFPECARIFAMELMVGHLLAHQPAEPPSS